MGYNQPMDKNTDLNELFCRAELSEEKAAGLLALTADSRFQRDRAFFVVRASCFLLSWLRDELVSSQCFDSLTLEVIGDDIEKRLPILKQMLSCQGEEYKSFLMRVSPYLILEPDDTCFGALYAFAHQLGDALKRAGYRVVYSGRTAAADLLIGKSYRGIIGFQNMSFCLRLSDGSFIFDQTDADIYDMVFDHPCWYARELAAMPERTCFLCLDRYYAEFINGRLGHRAVFFPPAGTKSCLCDISFEEYRREKIKYVEYPLSFLGTIDDRLEADLDLIRERQPALYPLALLYVDRMQREIKKPQDMVLMELLSEDGAMERYFGQKEAFSDADFSDFLRSWAFLGKDLSMHLRTKVIKEILDAGIELHVFDQSFNKFKDYPNLHIHPGVGYQDTQKVYLKSLVSIGMMTGHKAGFTERTAGILLGGSLCFTEGSDYIDEEFDDGNDIEIFYPTEEGIRDIPSRLAALLSDKERTLMRAYKGMRKASRHHTWDSRVICLERALNDRLDKEILGSSHKISD